MEHMILFLDGLVLPKSMVVVLVVYVLSSLRVHEQLCQVTWLCDSQSCRL